NIPKRRRHLPSPVREPSPYAKQREQNHAHAPRPLSGRASARVARVSRAAAKGISELWSVALGEFLSRLRLGLSGASRRRRLRLGCRWVFRRTCRRRGVLCLGLRSVFGLFS